MIWGIGGPIAKLIRVDAITDQVITLERPTQRQLEDFDEVEMSLGNDVRGLPVSQFLGVRFHAKYHWTSLAINSVAMTQVLRVGNWRGDGLTVGLWPHSDLIYKFICEVVGCEIKPLNGKVSGEEIVIEFLGTSILPKKPNPQLDLVMRAMGRGHITSGSWINL